MTAIEQVIHKLEAKNAGLVSVRHSLDGITLVEFDDKTRIAISHVELQDEDPETRERLIRAVSGQTAASFPEVGLSPMEARASFAQRLEQRFKEISQERCDQDAGEHYTWGAASRIIYEVLAEFRGLRPTGA